MRLAVVETRLVLERKQQARVTLRSSWSQLLSSAVWASADRSERAGAQTASCSPATRLAPPPVSPQVPVSVDAPPVSLGVPVLADAPLPQCVMC